MSTKIPRLPNPLLFVPYLPHLVAVLFVVLVVLGSIFKKPDRLDNEVVFSKTVYSELIQTDCGGMMLQPRPAFVDVEVPFEAIDWPPEDGDTIEIRWFDQDGRLDDVETVRFFGADTPEIEHPEMGWFDEQPYAYEAQDFLINLLGAAGTIEIARGDCLDPYGRTLAYLLADGENVSTALVRAGLACETIGKYGHQGFVDEAAEIMVAASEVEPLFDENPHDFRARMRAMADR